MLASFHGEGVRVHGAGSARVEGRDGDDARARTADRAPARAGGRSDAAEAPRAPGDDRAVHGGSVPCDARLSEPLTFFLGTHKTYWLADSRFAEIPLFVSRRALDVRAELPRAVGPWALDSGGFTELALHGGWSMPAREYVARVRRFRDEIGNLAWAAPQDWMCEPEVVARTGLSVTAHQVRTVRNLLELRAIAPELPIVPVLQGFTEAEYLRCRDLYATAGVDLTAEPLVGVGSVCRREATTEAARIFRRLRAEGLRCHAFGAKTAGLALYGSEIASADSLAWSFAARARKIRLEGCTHACCNNCPRWALLWRAEVLRRIP